MEGRTAAHAADGRTERLHVRRLKMRLQGLDRVPLLKHPHRSLTEALGFLPVGLRVLEKRIHAATVLGANRRHDAERLRRVIGEIGIRFEVEAAEYVNTSVIRRRAGVLRLFGRQLASQREDHRRHRSHDDHRNDRSHQLHDNPFHSGGIIPKPFYTVNCPNFMV